MILEQQLFNPLQIKSIEFKNRIWMSPMCQYSSKNGFSNDWHLVHLGSRAVGGVGLLIIEATAITPEGRISSDDLGIWSDEHISGLQRIVNFVKEQGAVCGIQLAHAGRKGSTAAAWKNKIDSAWQTIAPSPIAFKENYQTPKEMTEADMSETINAFVEATERCVVAGFEVLELHMAHGYLMHQFLSPISNHRQDIYGGTLENRMRFPLTIAQAVREKWPKHLPMFARISATDWAHGVDEYKMCSPRMDSWGLFESIVFAGKLKEIGVDLIDCSSGGTLPHAVIPAEPGYQVPFSAAIRKQTGIMTAAVGLITDPIQAETILLERQADAVFLGRELLRNPYWPMDAFQSFKLKPQRPKQYERA